MPKALELIKQNPTLLRENKAFSCQFIDFTGKFNICLSSTHKDVRIYRLFLNFGVVLPLLHFSYRVMHNHFFLHVLVFILVYFSILARLIKF